MCVSSRKSWILLTVSTCTTAVSFSKSYTTAVFVLFTVTCFFAGVLGAYDTIKGHLTQIFTCATLNVKNMLLEIFICVKAIIS